MCRPTSNINSDINGARRYIYVVTWRYDRINDNGYPKYNHDLHSNLHGSGLSCGNGYRNGNNQPTSTNHRNLDSLFGLNVAINERSKPRYME
jgi:hypothetical protein